MLRDKCFDSSESATTFVILSAAKNHTFFCSSVARHKKGKIALDCSDLGTHFGASSFTVSSQMTDRLLHRLLSFHPPQRFSMIPTTLAYGNYVPGRQPGLSYSSEGINRPNGSLQVNTYNQSPTTPKPRPNLSPISLRKYTQKGYRCRHKEGLAEAGPLCENFAPTLYPLEAPAAPCYASRYK
jgi:hypothetical protein